MGVSTSAAIVAGAVSVAGGTAKAIQGAKQKKRAEKALKNYKRQELKNVFETQRVSTLGSDLRREENNRAFSTSVDALRSGGIRGVVGGVGRLQENQNNQNRQIAANLDQQQVAIDRLKAQDDARIRSQQEFREQEDLRGLGAERAAGQQTLNQGIGDIVQGVGTAVGGVAGAGGGGQQASAGTGQGFNFQQPQFQQQSNFFNTNPVFSSNGLNYRPNYGG